MTPAEALRARATALRAAAATAADEHSTLARQMARTETKPNESAALALQALVADCMARRYQLWAARLDEAAFELENP